jgi:hypothetical protein
LARAKGWKSSSERDQHGGVKHCHTPLLQVQVGAQNPEYVQVTPGKAQDAPVGGGSAGQLS